MIKKACNVINNIKTALQRIYRQRWLLPYSKFMRTHRWPPGLVSERNDRPEDGSDLRTNQT